MKELKPTIHTGCPGAEAGGPWGLTLTCPPGVAEVALHHAAGLAVPAADPAPVLFGRRPDDAITADFLNDREPGYSVSMTQGVLQSPLLRETQRAWGRGPMILSEAQENIQLV